jgi:uncharacterized protein (DUF2336 family)
LFPKLEGLDNLARRDGVDTRPTLVRVLTDLYIQKPAHSSEEERHYTELVLRLIDTVDLATRVAVAKKIAVYPGAPPAVARRLARDVIEVAEPVLRHSMALTVTDFDAIVRDFGFEHACIIASRHMPMTAPVVLPTVAGPKTNVDDVDIDVALNVEVRVESDESVRASADLELAGLFFAADPAARRMLLMSVGNAEGEAPPVPMVSPREQPNETIRALESAALSRDRAEFTSLLERALRLTREKAERIVNDPSGEPLLVAAKAVGMPSIVLQRVLMFIDPAIGESVQRVFELAALYERIHAQAALRIIGSLRGDEIAQLRRPALRPVYYDDEAARSRRGSGLRRGTDSTSGADSKFPHHPQQARSGTSNR